MSLQCKSDIVLPIDPSVRVILTLFIQPVGVAARYKFTKRMAFMTEYFYVVPGQSIDTKYTNSLSVGLDIETGGHVFQLHFTNALGMNERAFITETDGDWAKGDIQFGFNVSRVFTIKERKKK